MDNQDPEIAESVRRRMLVFTDLARLPALDMRILLENVEGHDVRIALRNADRQVREPFLTPWANGALRALRKT